MACNASLQVFLAILRDSGLQASITEFDSNDILFTVYVPVQWTDDDLQLTVYVPVQWPDDDLHCLPDNKHSQKSVLCVAENIVIRYIESPFIFLDDLKAVECGKFFSV